MTGAIIYTDQEEVIKTIALVPVQVEMSDICPWKTQKFTSSFPHFDNISDVPVDLSTEAGGQE